MNDLDELLRHAGHDLTLRTPLSEVAGRGRTMRRRRRARRTAAITAAAAVATVGGALVLTSAGDPGTTDSPATTAVAAGWSASLMGLPGDVTADYAALCRATGNQAVADGVRNPRAATDVFNSTPVASTQLDGPGGNLAVLVFHSGSAFASCAIDPDQVGGPAVTLLQSLPELVETGAYVTPTGTYGSTDLALAVGTSSPEVAAVHIDIDGTPISATVDNGVFAAVVPADTTHETLLASTVEAFDSSGASLEQVPLLP